MTIEQTPIVKTEEIVGLDETVHQEVSLSQPLCGPKNTLVNFCDHGSPPNDFEHLYTDSGLQTTFDDGGIAL